MPEQQNSRRTEGQKDRRTAEQPGRMVTARSAPGRTETQNTNEKEKNENEARKNS